MIGGSEGYCPGPGWQVVGFQYLCIMDISLNHRKNTIKSKSMKSITRQKQELQGLRKGAVGGGTEWNDDEAFSN